MPRLPATDRTPKSFYPPLELLERIKAAAREAGLTDSAWIIEACEEKLDRERDRMRTKESAE